MFLLPLRVIIPVVKVIKRNLDLQGVADFHLIAYSICFCYHKPERVNKKEVICSSKKKMGRCWSKGDTAACSKGSYEVAKKGW